LALEKETVSAPSKLEPAARKLGLQPATAGQIATAQSPESKREAVDTSDTEKASTR
jgi:hypothetical protein